MEETDCPMFLPELHKNYEICLRNITNNIKRQLDELKLFLEDFDVMKDWLLAFIDEKSDDEVFFTYVSSGLSFFK